MDVLGVFIGVYLRHSRAFRRVSLSGVLLTPVLVSSCFSETVTCLIHLSFFLSFVLLFSRVTPRAKFFH